MAIYSMTGFARSTGSTNNTEWTIELRSVNGRGLDLRTRLPSGSDGLENEIRKRLKNNFERGNISLTLNIKRDKNVSRMALDEEALKDILAAVSKAESISNLQLTSLDALLDNKHILREIVPDDDPEEEAKLQFEILKTLEETINNLKQARKDEGANLATTIAERLDKIEKLITQAENCPDYKSDTILEKLRSNIELLLNQTDELDPSRLNQEAILLATKADISEEIDRLKAHIKQALELLQSKKPIGRRLDFLCQEFNREANTICSKSNSKDLTYIGLEMKTIIDQMREQVQNIE